MLPLLQPVIVFYVCNPNSRVWEKLKEAIEGFVAKGAMQPTMARVAFGLGECKHCLVGAAPITVDILEYFKSIEFPVRELYGMSECSGPHSLNLEDAWKIGSVGRVMLGVQVKMDQPDQNGDGEVGHDLHINCVLRHILH